MGKHFVLLIALLMGLTACTSNPITQQQAMNETTTPAVTTGNELTNTPGVDTNKTVGGNIGQSMDSADQRKMSKALDKPLGKETTWQNLSSGISYIVVPTAKTEVNGNRLCRKYNTTATRGGETQQFTGTACITADGNWHPVG